MGGLAAGRACSAEKRGKGYAGVRHCMGGKRRLRKMPRSVTAQITTSQMGMRAPLQEPTANSLEFTGLEGGFFWLVEMTQNVGVVGGSEPAF
jgi:hypothetical protein